jgi:MFS family permease
MDGPGGTIGLSKPDAAAAGSRIAAIYPWYVVGFLTLAATLSIIDRQILALMIGPVKRDLGVSDTMMGLLGGLAFTLFYTALTWPMAWLADRGSRRRIIGFCMVFWSLATISCGMAGRYWQLFAARMGVGVGEAALYPAAISLLSDYFARTRLPLALGIFSAAPLIGIGLANLLGGLVIRALAGRPELALPLFGQVRAWQAMFIIVGTPGLLLALLAWSVREPLRLGRAAARQVPEGGLGEALGFFLERRAFLGFLFAAFIAQAIQAWGFFYWAVELLVREHGVPRGTVGIEFGAIALVFGTLGSIASGVVSSRMMRAGRSDATLVVALRIGILLIPLAIAMPLVPGFGLAMVVTAGLLFLMGWPAGLLTTALQLIVPNQLRGRVVALYFIIVNFVSFSCGPLLGGLISDRVFGGASLGKTLALMGSIDYPLSAILLWLSLPHFRRALASAQDWTG